MYEIFGLLITVLGFVDPNSCCFRFSVLPTDTVNCIETAKTTYGSMFLAATIISPPNKGTNIARGS